MDKTLKMTRRRMLKATGLAGAALLTGALAGCDTKAESKSVAPGASSSEGPEVKDLNFGMIALTDCSPIVIAHEKGFFKKHGIEATIIKGASWAAIRDSLSNGDIQATHMLIGMPLASTMGLAGAPKKPMIVPWLLNRNGQAITVKTELKGKVKADPKVLKPMVEAAKAKGTPMTFAMTFPPG